MGLMDILNPISAVADIGLGVGKMVYDAHQQKITREREDNAVQRRVADLKSAGLSPTLAAGSAAATSAPINVPIQQNLQAKLKAVQDITAQKQDISQSAAATLLAQANALKTQAETLSLNTAREQIPYRTEEAANEAALSGVNLGERKRNIGIAGRLGQRSDIAPNPFNTVLQALSEMLKRGGTASGAAADVFGKLYPLSQGPIFKKDLPKHK